jgi:signal transduction histidine kinase
MLDARELAASDAFAGLGPEGLALLAQGAERRRYEPGGVIFQQEDEADGLYIVVEGAVVVRLESSGGAGELASIGPRGIVGEMSLLGRARKRTAGARAGPDGAAVHFLPIGTLRELRARYPADFATGVLSLAGEVVQRLDVANHRLVRQLASERRDNLQRDLVVHDLRSPLAMIESGVQALLRREDVYGACTGKQRHALQRVERNLAFLRLLADSILEVERTRVNPGQQRVTSVAEVIQACAAPLMGLLAPDRWLALEADDALAALRGTRLSVHDDEALRRPLRADPLRLSQVVLNLVGNALRYTAGPVELRAREAGEMLALDLSDHGPGIPEALREAIFDAFQQRDLQDRKLPVGKGFGLSGVRELVASMDGTIRALDRDDGAQGTLFRVELPLEAA